MSTIKIPLCQIKIASPCTASWDMMSGDDRVRFCGQCSQHVYNLSELTHEEVETLILQNEDVVCVRFYQRPDGTVLTADCPVGLRAIRRRFAILAGLGAGFAAAVICALTLGAIGSARAEDQGRARFNPIQLVRNWLFPPPPPCIMGKR